MTLAKQLYVCYAEDFVSKDIKKLASDLESKDIKEEFKIGDKLLQIKLIMHVMPQ